jgi:hypothetical protein
MIKPTFAHGIPREKLGGDLAISSDVSSICCYNTSISGHIDGSSFTGNHYEVK